ncbi:MAG TPA: hypothetical protein DCZ55_06790 [Cyanobacteria bacterium UBA11371]|nr:hypothetical protein [Cyanobacteria bacterium UBA11371]HBE30600.1 hypothetical protein [Cyanobacteria bacterium UBA11368]
MIHDVCISLSFFTRFLINIDRALGKRESEIAEREASDRETHLGKLMRVRCFRLSDPKLQACDIYSL